MNFFSRIGEYIVISRTCYTFKEYHEELANSIKDFEEDYVIDKFHYTCDPTISFTMILKKKVKIIV